MNADDTETPREPITTVIVTQDCPHCLELARAQEAIAAAETRGHAPMTMLPRFDPLNILETLLAVIGAVVVIDWVTDYIFRERAYA